MGRFIALLGDALVVLVAWLVVPLISLSIVAFAGILAKRVFEEDLKISSLAGWWAGLSGFSMYVIHSISMLQPPNTFIDRSLALDLPGAICGVVAGYGILWTAKRLFTRRAIGFLTFALAFLGSSSLFSYLFVHAHQNFILSILLGIALGSLLHVVAYPGTVQVFQRRKNDGKSLTKHFSEEVGRPYLRALIAKQSGLAPRLENLEFWQG